MATNVGRSISELTKQTQKLTQEVRASKNEVGALDKKLKINPGNVDLVRQKYAQLANQLKANQDKIVLLNKKRAALDAGWKSGTIDQQTYERELVKTKAEITRTEKAITQCTSALANQNAEMRQAKVTGIVQKLDKVQVAAQKVSRAALGVVVAFAALLKKGIEAGGELDDLAKKYSTTAEAIQYQQHRYLILTGSQDGYVSSLEKIGSIQSSIAAGRGARYLNYLKKLGITQDDLNGKNNGEIYEMIAEKLSAVADSTERATIAQGLFGSTGLDVAVVTGATAEELQKLDDIVVQNGIITNEQAAIAGEAGDRFDELKGKFESTSVAVLTDLMPIIEGLTDFLKNTALPILEDITGAIGNMSPEAQKMLFLLLLGIIVLPKIIGFIKSAAAMTSVWKTATMGQAAATTALTTASTPWLPIITAIGLALMLVISLVSMFINKGKSAVETSEELINSLSDTKSKLNDMGINLESSAEITHNDNTKKDLNVNVDVDVSGDTESGQEYAEDVGTIIYESIRADILNESLGKIVR